MSALIPTTRSMRRQAHLQAWMLRNMLQVTGVNMRLQVQFVVELDALHPFDERLAVIELPAGVEHGNL